MEVQSVVRYSLPQHVSDGIPPHVRIALDSFVDAVVDAARDHLVCVALFGSAADASMRPTSDVNLVIVLTKYEMSDMIALRSVYRFVREAANINAMFILESELELAMNAFSVKFNDIIHRHVMIAGRDVFAERSVPREAALRRVRHVLLNLAIRLRERYLQTSEQRDDLVRFLAHIASPVRSAAMTVMLLSGHTLHSPKQALSEFVALNPTVDRTAMLSSLSAAREGKAITAAEAESAVESILDVLDDMRDVVEALSKREVV